MRAIVFGATTSAKDIYERIDKEYEIIAFCDNDINKQGKEIWNGKTVIAPESIKEKDFDEIVIISRSSLDVIKKQLLDMGISERRINTSFVEQTVVARKQFLIDFAKIVYKYEMVGSVAEAGVFQGEFAKEINAVFPDRKLYLFDTFEGFDVRDTNIEQENGFSNSMPGYLGITSENMVLDKMQYRDLCKIYKGYFPESAKEIDDQFVFVNLDMDLYKPTIEGLGYFWPKMVKGGIIVVHDYFSEGYKGINAAVDEFVLSVNSVKICLTPFPIGDGVSIALQKII